MNRPSLSASYTDLFDRMHHPILLLDTQGTIIDANPGAESFFNKNIEELKLMNLDFLFDSKEDMEKVLRMALRRYHPRSQEKTVLIDGQTKHLILESCPLELKEENLTVIQFLIKDQTELVEAKLQLEASNKLLSEISITDKLTGLFNRRHFDDSLAKEIERASRGNSDVSLILFDVDKFKVYNDTNGHSAGDTLLGELAKIIKDNIRGVDIACRYGGEEFVIICPQTDKDSAFILAERIRYAVKNNAFEHKEKQPLGFVSVSIGIASLPFHTKNGEDLLKLADTALYHSKENGRNQTTVFNHLEEVKKTA